MHDSDPTTPDSVFARDERVRSSSLGEGTVVLDEGATVVVRFAEGIHACDKSDLRRLVAASHATVSGQWGEPIEVITRLQADAIRSVNDTWGVFARSKIDLLPHQLWVCRRVLQTLPARWLVADDVGLGKTIEAGLILTALKSRGLLDRVLVLCPASLTEQWQQRLLEMFDVRMARYAPELDKPKLSFWAVHDRVIASVQTLRADRTGRHDRLFDADAWDMVIVDEAHHLNADEESGPTLGYKLVQKLVERGRVRSMVFFTGTPHRGKNFGFLSLLKLLHPDRFDPSKPVRSQLPGLADVMIRNNKYTVTDLKGQRLFRAPTVETEDYSYTPVEAAFYQMLTEFIVSGKAYAGGLADATQGRAVMLVLIAMQKLASSSVAAIGRAIRGRLGRIGRARDRHGQLVELREDLKRYREAEQTADLDSLSRLEEQIAESDIQLRLMEDEEDRLRELLAAADAIDRETKISRLVERVRSVYTDRSVLFFTEYKATQALLMSALMQAFGKDCVTFINGDGRVDGVVDAPGAAPRSISEPRDRAADRFNGGAVRFLVSTEAAGEGIDLQENCYTLVHVDLPWNPMRMHQRVGRLNRLGQTQTVQVLLLRNPDTVESRIWDKLTTKIDEINAALVNVMDDPEDLTQLVLGMAPSSLYRELFAEAAAMPRQQLSGWFDDKTAQLGGRDAVDAVREMMGHCAHFDFQEASSLLPRVDLPDLKPFVLAMLQRNRRRPQLVDGALAFKTPDAWREDPRIRPAYEGLVFDRRAASRGQRERVMGMGHPVFDQAIARAMETDATVTRIDRATVAHPILVYEVTDRVTSESAWVRRLVVGVRCCDEEGAALEILYDWQLLREINRMKPAGSADDTPVDVPLFDRLEAAARRRVETEIPNLPTEFRRPHVSLHGAVWPTLPKE